MDLSLIIAALQDVRRANDILSSALIFTLQRLPSSAVKIVVGWPVIERNGIIMADKQVIVGTTKWVPIHTLNAEGMVVPAPTGDVDTATSSDATNLVASIDVMPAGAPMAGAVALKLVSPVSGAAVTGISITVSDSAGLMSETDLVDTVADTTPKSISLDWVDSFTQPSA